MVFFVRSGRLFSAGSLLGIITRENFTRRVVWRSYPMFCVDSWKRERCFNILATHARLLHNSEQVETPLVSIGIIGEPSFVACMEATLASFNTCEANFVWKSKAVFVAY